MRVGQSPFSAHQAGMSSLWHDVDYLPEQRFETPLVHKHGLEDMALPSEQHQLPEGVDDPFKKLDAIFDLAAEQMDRGIKGASFLHGSAKAASQKVVEAVRTDLEQVRMQNQAAATTIPKTKGATKTAAESEAAAQAPNMASGASDALGAVATFMPMAVGTGIQTAVQGPLPALASQAVTVVGTAASAAQVTAVGVAEGLKEEAPVVPRRGLSKKV